MVTTASSTTTSTNIIGNRPPLGILPIYPANCSAASAASADGQVVCQLAAEPALATTGTTSTSSRRDGRSDYHRLVYTITTTITTTTTNVGAIVSIRASGGKGREGVASV
jgi:hypothetical protein